MSDLMKIRLMGDESFRAQKPTDMTKQIIAIRNFKNEPKNY